MINQISAVRVSLGLVWGVTLVLKNGSIGENRKDYFDSKKTVSVLVENDALAQDKV